MATILVGVLAITLVAASPDAAVQGVVRDAVNGRPLSAVTVLLVDLDRSTITDANGRYALNAVAAGPQHLTLHALGYEPRKLHLLVPGTGKLDVDIALNPAPIRLRGIGVVTRVPVRGLEGIDSTAFPERAMTQASLQHHPTLAQKDALLALSGGEVVISPEAPTGVHVRGGASDHTGYLLDGIPVFSPYHTAGVLGAWNPDAIAAVQLAGAAPSFGLPDALSGSITAQTQEPRNLTRIQATLSTAEARITIDGPLGFANAAYLLSWRSAFPGAIAAKREASYLNGEMGDLIGKLRVPAAGGLLRLLWYDAANEIGVAGAPVADSSHPSVTRNRFEWESRSYGATWDWTGAALPAGAIAAQQQASTHDSVPAQHDPTFAMRIALWGAEGAASALWDEGAYARQLRSARVDHAVHASIIRKAWRASTEAGIRIQETSTSYNTDSAGVNPYRESNGSAYAGTLYLEHSREFGARTDLWGGVSASLTDDRLRVSPRARLRWRSSEHIEWTIAFSRTHQFAQSLRNPESVVGQVFPVDLFVRAGRHGVSVAQSDQLVLASEWKPVTWLRLGVQTFDRHMTGLALIAPSEVGPFATAPIAEGSGHARGASLELSAHGASFSASTSYGLQATELTTGDSSYTPHHASTHRLDAGVMWFPTPTAALRASITAIAGRRTTGIAGGFEWEACNVQDRGCEFAGSPALAGKLGGDAPPAYLRLDIGARKHWHVTLRDRDVLIGVFGTLANVLSRHNVLAYTIDPVSGDRKPITMVPRTPLVIGMDARFD